MGGADPTAPPDLGRLAHQIQLAKANLHVPLDDADVTLPPAGGVAAVVDGLAVPPPALWRYPPDQPLSRYIESGAADAARIRALAAPHLPPRPGRAVLDFGCASGRVLRHFTADWQCHGVDLDARMIDWLRRNWPNEVTIFTGHALPHLPLPDRSLDLVYAVSVFPHLKYHWDAWLMEWRRVLRPGGLCIFTAQCEAAWSYYRDRRNEPWVAAGHPPDVLAAHAELPDEYVLIGDTATSQTFFRRSFLAQAVARYFTLVDWAGCAPFGYQDWIVLQKAEAR